MLCFQSKYFQVNNGTPVFLKMVFVFQKICFKVEVLKMCKISSDYCPIKTPISQTEGYFENPKYRFLEKLKTFLLALTWNLEDKAFSCAMTKTNSDFVVKVLERNNHSFSVYLTNHLVKRSILYNMWQWNV